MDNDPKLNLSHTMRNHGNKTVNYEGFQHFGDTAMMESLILADKKNEEVPITDEQIEEAIVYSNDVTSIDFMMPEDERQIVEKNLNMYGNLEQMQKVLNMAKKNKKISEDIKSLELISKAGNVSNLLFDILSDEETIEAVKENIQNQIKSGDVMKGYKNIATANKILLDAREDMKRSLNTDGNRKNAKIALKFTNDNGEDFQLGVDI